MFRTEHNSETGEVTEIALTAQEIAEFEAQWAATAAQVQAELEAAANGSN